MYFYCSVKDGYIMSVGMISAYNPEDKGYISEERYMELVEAFQSKPEPPTEEYPEFVVGKWYYNGDKCSFGGKNYTCTAPTGTVCVWSPTDYPAYWKEV